MANQEQHSTIQTVFVSHQIGKDGKPVTNVVAYRNGHKISDQQSKKNVRKYAGEPTAPRA